MSWMSQSRASGSERLPSRRSRFGASAVAFAEAEATRTERAGVAARESACGGVRGAKPLG
jgi:hypothetical protein